MVETQFKHSSDLRAFVLITISASVNRNEPDTLDWPQQGEQWGARCSMGETGSFSPSRHAHTHKMAPQSLTPAWAPGTDFPKKSCKASGKTCISGIDTLCTFSGVINGLSEIKAVKISSFIMQTPKVTIRVKKVSSQCIYCSGEDYGDHTGTQRNHLSISIHFSSKTLTSIKWVSEEGNGRRGVCRSISSLMYKAFSHPFQIHKPNAYWHYGLKFV